MAWKSLIVKDRGRKLRVWLRGSVERASLGSLERAKAAEAQRYREGRDFFGHLTIQPNERLAQRIEEMSMYEWLEYSGLVSQCELMEER